MDYVTVRTVHETAVALSLAGFFARGAGGLAGAAWVKRPLAQQLPQVVDSVLLASAVTLVWIGHIDLVRAPWLGAKLAGVVVYIVLGVVALRAGLPRPVRAAAWVAALCTAGWIVSVAITKRPLGVFSLP